MAVSNREFFLTFLLGCSVGVLFTVIYNELGTSINVKFGIDSQPLASEGDRSHYDNLISTNLDESHSPLPPVIYNIARDGPIIFNDLESTHHKDGDIVARTLARKIKVLCWVMTSPKNLYTKGQAVKDTWGKRCNILLFMSSKEDKKFPAVGLDVPEGRHNLWLKTRAAWKYIYDNHFGDADWFIKVDDDSFVILENLRYFLSRYNSSNTHYFGRHFVPFKGYNSGGAGYVFSKETIRRFVRVMKDPSKCKLKSFAEDVEVGMCLRAEDVYPGDTRDEMARQTFHPFTLESHLIPGALKKNNWLYQYDKWEVKSGLECCSDHTITFHYIVPKQMYILEYFIYHLHAYGVHHVHD